MIISDLCVMEMDRDRRRFRVIEIAPDVTPDEITERTTAEILFADELRTIDT
jgi:acyl CoA:acetate/3-ketoacid CoA transferase beta subunit